MEPTVGHIMKITLELIPGPLSNVDLAYFDPLLLATVTC